MFKRSLLTVISLIIIASSADASERWPNWYVGAHGNMPFIENTKLKNGGVQQGNVKFDSGIGGGASIGYMPRSNNALLNQMRFEAEISTYKNDISRVNFPSLGNPKVPGDITADTYMVNAFYDMNMQSAFTPYIGAGLGIADVKMNLFGLSKDDRVLAYQFMGGISYAPELIPNTEFSIGYRFLSTSTVKLDGIDEINYNSHNLEVGARFKF